MGSSTWTSQEESVVPGTAECNPETAETNTESPVRHHSLGDQSATW